MFAECVFECHIVFLTVAARLSLMSLSSVLKRPTVKELPMMRSHRRQVKCQSLPALPEEPSPLKRLVTASVSRRISLYFSCVSNTCILPIFLYGSEQGSETRVHTQKNRWVFFGCTHLKTTKKTHLN